MSALLLSDLHLDETRPEMIAAFETLCAGPARGVAQVYVLGDLFEAWVGDDDDSPLAARVAGALGALTERGVDVAFQHGNRDFLLGARYAARCGMRLLPEVALETIEGTPTLLMHGDSLCTDDAAYLSFRAQVRDATWQQRFLAQPLSARREFARQARAESTRHTAHAAPVLMDVSPPAVREALHNSGASRLIHGHTHRPGLHVSTQGTDLCERIVLPDWYHSAAWLRIEGGMLQFESA